MEKPNKILGFGLILGLSLLASFLAAAVIVAQTFLNVKKMDNVISVSGSAKQAVTSDSARWTGNFSRTVLADGIKAGYTQMKSDEKTVTGFFETQGFKGKFDISPVFMNQVYKSDQNAPTEYNLVQNIEVKADDVDRMTMLAKDSDQLASQGIIFSANPVEYYYSKLPDLRVSLLPAAIKDAKNRAEAIASSSGKQVDTVKSVTMGVVQVMPVGTVDVSDYGSYDTSEIQKEVMVTAKVTFGLK
jgi:hypothetical protein